MTDKQKTECKRLYLIGVTVKNIPKLIDSTSGSVERYLYKTLGVRSRNRIHTLVDFNIIKRLRQMRMNEKEIMNMTGIDRMQLRYILRRNGSSLRQIDKGI
jgi:hypothetical protein